MANDEKKYKLRLETEGDDAGAKKVEKALDKTAEAADRVESAGAGTAAGFEDTNRELEDLQGWLDETNKHVREANEEFQRQASSIEDGNGMLKARLGIYTALAAAALKASSFARNEIEEIRALSAEAAAEIEQSWSGAFLLALDPRNFINDIKDQFLEPMREAKQLAKEAHDAAAEAEKQMLDMAREEGRLDFRNWQQGLERVNALQRRVQESTRASMALEQQRADNDLLLTEKRIDAMKRLIAAEEAAGRISSQAAETRRAALEREGVGTARAKEAADLGREQRLAERTLVEATERLAGIREKNEKVERRLNGVIDRRSRIESQLADTDSDRAPSADLREFLKKESSRLGLLIEAMEDDLATHSEDISKATEAINDAQTRIESLKESLSEKGSLQQALAGLEDLAATRESEISNGVGDAAKKIEEVIQVATEGNAQLSEGARTAKAELEKIIADAVVSSEEIGKVSGLLSQLINGSTAAYDAMSNALSTAEQSIRAQTLRIENVERRLQETDARLRAQAQRDNGFGR